MRERERLCVCVCVCMCVCVCVTSCQARYVARCTQWRKTSEQWQRRREPGRWDPQPRHNTGLLMPEHSPAQKEGMKRRWEGRGQLLRKDSSFLRTQEKKQNKKAWLTMCRLRQSTRAVSWWRPTSVEFSTDWICSRLPCIHKSIGHTYKPKCWYPPSCTSTHTHVPDKHICADTFVTASFITLPLTPIQSCVKIKTYRSLHMQAHAPWCWHNHVLLISVALPHHPASPPMLCGSLRASTKHTVRHGQHK